MTSRKIPGPFMAAYRLRRQSKPGHLSKPIWTDDKFRARLESVPNATVILKGFTVGNLHHRLLRPAQLRALR